MRRSSIGALVLLVFALAARGAAPQQNRGTFVPPRCTAASDMAYPIDTTTSGLVTFAVSLDPAGHVSDVRTLRDVPPLTAAALVALKSWTFTPATLDGSAVASNIIVDILYNPGNAAFGNTPPLASDEPMPGSEQEYAPPHMVSAAYANYPVTTMLSGPVVFDVQVGKSGRVRKATAVYTTPSLVSAATSAVKKWKFTAGEYQRAPLVSSVVVAFVFRSPTISTPYGSQQQ